MSMLLPGCSGKQQNDPQTDEEAILKLITCIEHYLFSYVLGFMLSCLNLFLTVMRQIFVCQLKNCGYCGGDNKWNRN